MPKPSRFHAFGVEHSSSRLRSVPIPLGSWAFMAGFIHRFTVPFLLLPLLFGACKPVKPTKKSVPQKVIVAEPVEQEVQRFEEYTGRFTPVDIVDVRARANGYLNAIHFREGAEVKTGDLLYTIDPLDYKALRDASAATVDQATARLSQSQADLERGKLLLKTSAIPTQELERLSTTVRESEASLRLAKAELDKADLNLGYTEIRSPITGKIGRTLITVGNLVQNGDSLTSIVRQDPLYVYFDVPERAVQSWNKNEELEVKIGLGEEQGFPHPATLDFTDNQLDIGTGTLKIRAVIPNPDRKFRPGYFARVRVAYGQPAKTLLVPDRAVGLDQGEKFVYVVSAENKALFRPVRTGQLYGNLRAIDFGLSPGEKVVSEGISLLRPGADVEIVKPESQQASKEVP